MGEESVLPILELRPEDLQDNILAAVGDTLTTLLEEELAAEERLPNLLWLNQLKQRSKLNQLVQKANQSMLILPHLKLRIEYYFLFL